MRKKIEQLDGLLKIAHLEICDLQNNSAYNSLEPKQQDVVLNCLSNAKRHRNGFR
jgi:hypothetical protein